MCPLDVLIAVRAPAPWLRETLISLRDQTYKSWRLILVMDGSSEDVARDCREVLPQFTPYSAPAGSGTVTALNIGLGHSTAPLVARIDADDVALPGRFAAQTEYLDANPDAVAVATGCEIIDDKGNLMAVKPLRISDVTRHLRWYNPLVQSSMVIRRAALDAAGGYRTDARHLEDYDLWLRLAGQGRIGVIAQPLVQYRRHPNQVTQVHGYSAQARAALAASRRELAQAEGRSQLASRFRQEFWSLVNRVQGR